jgi:hypothetical protein
MKIDFDTGIIWWTLVAIPLTLLSIILYRKKIISAKALVRGCTPIILIASNLVAISQAAPDLHLISKLLIAIGATLLIIPFLMIGELLRASRQV